MKILTPFRYCEFRLAETGCDKFASGVVEGMSFCESHVNYVTKGLDDSGVELVKSKILDWKAG